MPDLQPLLSTTSTPNLPASQCAFAPEVVPITGVQTSTASPATTTISGVGEWQGAVARTTSTDRFLSAIGIASAQQSAAISSSSESVAFYSMMSSVTAKAGGGSNKAFTLGDYIDLSTRQRKAEGRVRAQRSIREVRQAQSASNSDPFVDSNKVVWANDCLRDYVRSVNHNEAAHTLIHTCSLLNRVRVRSECQVQGQVVDIRMRKFGDTHALITKDTGNCATHPFLKNDFLPQQRDERHSYTKLTGANGSDCVEVYSEMNTFAGTSKHIIVNSCDLYSEGDIVESCAVLGEPTSFYVSDVGDTRVRVSKDSCNAKEAIKLRGPVTRQVSTHSTVSPTTTPATTRVTTEPTTAPTTAPATTTRVTTAPTTTPTTAPTTTPATTTRATTEPTTAPTTTPATTTKATTQPTTEQATTATPAKIINNIHQPSMKQAASTLVRHEGGKVEILIKFPSKECKNKISTSVCDEGLQACPDGWQSKNPEIHAAIFALNRNQTTRLLGLSVTDHECIEGISAETLSLRLLRKERAQHEKIAELRAQLETDSTEVCVPLEETVLKFEGMNGQTERIQAVKCVPKLTRYSKPSEETLNSPEAKAAEEACISRLALISDGVPVNSHLAFSVATAMGNSTADNDRQGLSLGERFVLSALRHCPKVKFDDCHASIKPSTSGALINPLKSHSVIKCLDAFSVKTNATRPDKVVLVDPVELSSYQPDIEVIDAYAVQLAQGGMPVLAYAASYDSWEQGLSNVQQVVTVDQVMQKQNAD